MNEQSIRWDDLQLVLAIAETGSLSGAGRRLGISHATVFRRLAQMEGRLQVRLFERRRVVICKPPPAKSWPRRRLRLTVMCWGLSVV
ncbi:LysR family transcriptional regulator [Alkalilimnicola ehrlichii]|uniref:helix-turn-helix domain-containing protein n=1 Tax=Alkalilimnicola ehrlichii TaxID=351052 RepID=UPI001C6E80B5